MPSRLYRKKWLSYAYAEHTYPGSAIARLKLNEIGGVLIQQWSMWFNAIIPAKSYQDFKHSILVIDNLYFFMFYSIAWPTSVRALWRIVHSN